MSVEFALTYEGGAFTSVVVDVARAEPGEGDVELVPAIPLREATGISGPTELACLLLRMHIAQKLHGMTLPPRPGKRNERFRDLIDVLLMAPLVTDYAGLRERASQSFALEPRTSGRPCSKCRRIGSIPSLNLHGTWICPCATHMRQ